MKRIKGFDGLRAIAVTCVFAAHMRPLDIPLSTVAVYVFFVLSGFLITGLLTDQREVIERGRSDRTSELVLFYYRRSLRIFPIYYVTLAGYAAWIWSTSGHSPAGLWSYILYVANIWMSTQSSCQDVLLCHFWSLAIEEQFYIFLAPLLILIARSRHMQVVVAVFVTGTLSLILVPALGFNERQQYLFSTTNFAMLAAGGIMSLLYRKPLGINLFKPGITGAALVTIIAFLLISGSLRRYSIQLFSLLFLATIVSISLVVSWLANHQESRLVKILEWQPLAYLGKVSYGFYLMHPACIHAYRFLVHWPDSVSRVVPAGALALFNATACFGITFLVSHISWQILERRILSLRDTPPPRLLAVRAKPETL